MPKEKDCLEVIPKIYKRNYLDITMFAYVNGVIQTVPGVTIKQALLRYMNWIGVTEDTYNLESALSQFTLMKKEFDNE